MLKVAVADGCSFEIRLLDDLVSRAADSEAYWKNYGSAQLTLRLVA